MMMSIQPPFSSFPQSLVIASRKSRLAIWQAEYVRTQLQIYYPDCQIEILGMTTRGDQMLDHSLSKVGGKGLFIKELEYALEEGKADLAVHALKDVPMTLPKGFRLAAVLERGDPFDAFVSSEYTSLETMPPNSTIGTSSLRREAILRRCFPYLNVQPLRGNLDTRLSKLDRGDYAAIILAAAGLKRLGMGSRIRSLLSVEESLPAVGQGALAIEILTNRTDLIGWLEPLQHTATALAVHAERTLANALGGSCQLPLAAYADWLDDKQLRLRAMVSLPDGSRYIKNEMQALVQDISAACLLGKQLAQRLFAQGANQILAAMEK